MRPFFQRPLCHRPSGCRAVRSRACRGPERSPPPATTANDATTQHGECLDISQRKPLLLQEVFDRGLLRGKMVAALPNLHTVEIVPGRDI